MGPTVHVVARFVAKSGKELPLRAALTAAVPPTRRELGCYQYDLLVSAQDPRDMCLVERWENDKAFEQHLGTDHVRTLLDKVEDLVESPPEIRRYQLA